MNLKNLIINECEKSSKVILNFPWENKTFYTNWLAQQYFLVQHTPRILCAFALRVPLENSDAFYDVLHHLRGESGHDSWLLKDLNKFDLTPAQFTPLYQTNALIKSQYYNIQHDTPISVFGYTQYLELISTQIAGTIAKRVEATFGPNTAIFLKGHAVSDVEHVEEAWHHLDNIDKQTELKIKENFYSTINLYTEILSKISHFEPSELNKAG